MTLIKYFTFRKSTGLSIFVFAFINYGILIHPNK